MVSPTLDQHACRLASHGEGAGVSRLCKSLDAYVRRDAAGAEEVRYADQEVDQLHTSMFRELLTDMIEDPHKITPSTHLLFIAKNIERIGDHATNIAEQIYFLVMGQDPEEARPKQDWSSDIVVEPLQSGSSTGKGGD